MDRIKSVFKNLLEIIGKNEMRILPGNLAFFLVLSVVPIITLVGFIASFFNIDLNMIINAMQNTFPKEVSELLIPFISGKGIDINVGISMITGFIAHSIIVASNTLYNIPNDDYLKRRIKAFLMTFLLVILFIFVVVVLAFGNHILAAILNLGIFKNISRTIYPVFVYAKWPIAYFLIFFLLKVLFTMAPDKRIPSRFVNKGVRFVSNSHIFLLCKSFC